MTSPRVLPRVPWPVVELLLEPGSGDELAPLVRSLALVCRPVAPDHTNEPAGRLLSSPHAPEHYLATREHHVPFAVVVRDQADLDHAVTAAATAVVVVGDAALVDAAGERAVVLSAHPVRASEALPVPPFMRDRLRAGTGLPDPFVVHIGRPTSAPMTESTIPTALRLATVADVCGPWTTTAMALGTPVVTDEATAALLGIVDGDHALVARAGDARVRAETLAADPVQCAALGRAGRRLVEERHDPDRTARELLTRLGIAGPSAIPTAVDVRLADRLGELGTPAGHPIELAFASRLTDLGVAPRTGGSWR